MKALCVVPMGMEEGTEADVPGDEIGLVVGESGAVPLFQLFHPAAGSARRPARRMG